MSTKLFPPETQSTSEGAAKNAGAGQSKGTRYDGNGNTSGRGIGAQNPKYAGTCQTGESNYTGIGLIEAYIEANYTGAGQKREANYAGTCQTGETNYAGAGQKGGANYTVAYLM